MEIYKEPAPDYQNYFRVALSVAATTAIIVHNLPGKQISIASLILALVLAGYCGFMYRRLLLEIHDEPIKTLWLYFAESALVTLAIAELNYKPWPSLLLIGLLQFNTLSQGGGRQWLKSQLGILSGVIISYFALGLQTIDLGSHQLLDIILLATALIYLLSYAICTNRFQRRLSESHDYFRRDSENFRSYAYKLSRYLPKPVSAMLKGKDYRLNTQRKRITVFFSDIAGFSELSEQLEAETLAELLNSYLSEMSKIANQHHGTIDKFIGDAIMVLFGDDDQTSRGVKKDAIQCVSMAIAMTKAMRELQTYWSELGIKKPLQIRIGINSGYCTVGTFGTDKNLDYTALGTHVNLASRLESAGNPGDILVSHETWSLIKEVILCRDRGQIKAKGFSCPIQVYEVINHRKDLGGNQSYLSKNMAGFSMHLDMEKLKNYNKDKIIATLEAAAKKLRDYRNH